MRVTCRLISEVISTAGGITLRELYSDSRETRLAQMRQVGWYLAREMTGSSWPQIGRAMGGRDHTTILHGHRQVIERMKSNEKLAEEVAALRQAVNMSAIALDKTKIELFGDIDPVAVADNLLNRPLRDAGPSIDETRALAMAVLHYAAEVEQLMAALDELRLSGPIADKHGLLELLGRDDEQLLPAAPTAGNRPADDLRLANLAHAAIAAWHAIGQAQFTQAEKPAREKFLRALNAMETHLKKDLI